MDEAIRLYKAKKEKTTKQQKDVSTFPGRPCSQNEPHLSFLHFSSLGFLGKVSTFISSYVQCPVIQITLGRTIFHFHHLCTMGKAIPWTIPPVSFQVIERERTK